VDIEAYFTSKMPAKLKMTVKGGAAVDPDSGLEADSHILQNSKGDPYNAVLGMVDIIRGTNSYYKLQIIESDKLNKYVQHVNYILPLRISFTFNVLISI